MLAGQLRCSKGYADRAGRPLMGSFFRIAVHIRRARREHERADTGIARESATCGCPSGSRRNSRRSRDALVSPVRQGVSLDGAAHGVVDDRAIADVGLRRFDRSWSLEPRETILVRPIEVIGRMRPRHPRCNSCCATWLPMNPAPPVRRSHSYCHSKRSRWSACARSAPRLDDRTGRRHGDIVIRPKLGDRERLSRMVTVRDTAT